MDVVREGSNWARKRWDRLGGLFILCLLSATAHANAAMGLALEMFVPWTWAIYVVAMIAIEAYWIGRRDGLDWPRSVTNSAIANLVTATLGVGCLCQGLAPFLHGAFIGSSVQPRPLPNACVLLVIVGLLSAVVESTIWSRRTPRRQSYLKPSIIAHLIGVPFALIVLLIPERPYVGLEAITNHQRGRRVEKALREALQSFETPPKTAETLLAKAREIEPSLDVSMRRAEFGRFDCTGGGGPIELPVTLITEGKWTVQWRGRTIASVEPGR